ncbi:hypothetical protein LTS18_010159, partial [Coniosporium uncinatum]
APTNNTTNQGTSSLFGSTQNNQQQQQQQQQHSTTNTSTLFGGTNQPQPTSTLFGASTTSQNRPLLTLGQSTSNTSTSTANAPTVPGVKIDLSNLRGTTRFSDLTPELASVIEAIDTHIQSVCADGQRITQALPNHGVPIDALVPDLKFISQKSDLVEVGHENDAQALAALKSLVDTGIEEARGVFGGVEMLRLPLTLQSQPGFGGGGGGQHQSHQQHQQQLIGRGFGLSAEEERRYDLVAYFSQRADELAERLERYKALLAEMEGHMRTVESTAVSETEALVLRRAGMGGSSGAIGAGGQREGSDDGRQGLRELAAAMKGFEDAVVRVATLIGECREKVVEAVVGSGGGGAYTDGGEGSGAGQEGVAKGMNGGRLGLGRSGYGRRLW